MSVRCTVRYAIATYAGTVEVWADENDDDDAVIARAREQLRRRSGGSFPFGAESWKVVARDEEVPDGST